MRHNCLTYALDRWHRYGGHLVLRKSQNWALPHVMHVDKEGLHHFLPPHELDSPACAICGFQGAAHADDRVMASPMPLRGIVAGGWVLAITVTVWAGWMLLKSIAVRHKE